MRELSRDQPGTGSAITLRLRVAPTLATTTQAMEITSSSAEAIGIRLAFLKPFKATNDVDLTFVAAGAATEVTWTMRGEQTGMAAVFSKLVPMDRLIGKDFEKGLARLKAVAEA